MISKYNNSSTPFGFYYISRQYIEAISENNPNVPKCDYEDEGRSRKFYCGPVLTHEGIDYYVPVSHQIKGDMVIPGTKQNGIPEIYGLALRNEIGSKTGNLDFRHMIPCVDTMFVKEYRPNGFGQEQAQYCIKNQPVIKTVAKSVYNNITSGDYEFLNNTSVQFESAIQKGWDYYDTVLKTNDNSSSDNTSGTNEYSTVSEDSENPKENTSENTQIPVSQDDPTINNYKSKIAKLNATSCCVNTFDNNETDYQKY